MIRKDCYNFECDDNMNGSCERYDLCVGQCGYYKDEE